MNALEKVIAIIVAALLMFIIPGTYFQIKKDSIIQVNVDKETSKFVEMVSTQGYVTKDMYENYLSGLGDTGKLYSVDLIHELTAYEPEYKLRTAGEVVIEDENAWTGANEYYEESFNTTIPVVIDPINNSGLAMNTQTNASVLAAAVNSPASPGHLHTDACYSGHRHVSSGCTALNGYYAGNAVGVNVQQSNDHNFSFGSKSNYRFINCTTCSNTISIAHYYESESSDIYFWGNSPIYLYQYYLSPSNQVVQETRKEERRYLTSTTNPGGWTHVVTNVNFGYGNIAINEYRLLNPVFANLVNTFYGVSDQWGNPYISNLHALGFKDDYSCPFCMKDGRLSKTLVGGYSCGQVQDETLICNQQVSSVIPTHSSQSVYKDEPLITTVIITCMDGSRRTVAGTTTFSTSNIGQSQTATLTYTYVISGVTYTISSTITVNVIPKSKTCVYGHTYNLNNDSSDPGCPFCTNWLLSLSLYVPTNGKLTMYRNPSGSLETEGIGLRAIYLDGHTEYIYNGYLDNLDPDYVGTQTVTIGYKGLLTSLQVIILRNRIQCGICGLYYDLYLDSTDPGCPYCKARVPVFTGNVLEYCAATYDDEIVTELYEGSGTYYFRRGDNFIVNTESKSKLAALSLVGRTTGLQIRVNKIDTIKDEFVHQ